MPVQKAMPTRTPTGFERFLEHGMAMAGQRRGGGGDRKTGAVFGKGWAQGLSRGQAIEKARSMYAALPDKGRKRWESEASLLDVRSKPELVREQKYRTDRAAALGIGGAAPGGAPVTKAPPGAGAQATNTPMTPPVGPPIGQQQSPAHPAGRGMISGRPTETMIGARAPSGTINYTKPDGSQWRTSSKSIREGFDPVRTSAPPSPPPRENKYFAGQSRSLGQMLDRVRDRGTMRPPQRGPLRN